MIYSLEGIIENTGKNFAVINVSGVGYKVFCSPDCISKMPQSGTPIKIYTCLEVKEDAMDLYGFLSIAELEFYEILRTVSGVGPKTALGVIALAPLKMLASAIAGKNADFVAKAPGVGRKTAEKIIVELKDKIKEMPILDNGQYSAIDTDLIEALRNMGYGTKESAEALGHVPQEIKGEQERLREALKLLNHKR